MVDRAAPPVTRIHVQQRHVQPAIFSGLGGLVDKRCDFIEFIGMGLDVPVERLCVGKPLLKIIRSHGFQIGAVIRYAFFKERFVFLRLSGLEENVQIGQFLTKNRGKKVIFQRGDIKGRLASAVQVVHHADVVVIGVIFIVFNRGKGIFRIGQAVSAVRNGNCGSVHEHARLEQSGHLIQ